MKNIIPTIILTALCCGTPAHAAQPTPEQLQKIKHIIVISLENHSFDNLFGNFPGAEGLEAAGENARQVDDAGKPYITLPALKDGRLPTDLPNRPFPIDTYIPAREATPDLVHRFYQEQEQINGGKMDRFAGVSDASALTMGYYDITQSTLWKYAQEYTLADHFFHAGFGGSFLNHFWLVCACTPRFENAPQEMKASVDATGKMIKDGAITPDSYAINTVYSAQIPHPKDSDKAKLLPPQTMPTIGSRLSEQNVDWAWYSGGWNDAVAGKPSSSFQFHHQPFAYFREYAEGKAARKVYLKDEADFLMALRRGDLPPVSFYKPLGEFNFHPGYARLPAGDMHLADILHAIEQSTVWKDSVVIVTFDENGGFWDHVAPPAGDRWGPGARVPTIIISPFARKHYVDHTVYDTTSILKFIETRFDLQPLGARDKAANDMTGALELE